MSATSHEPNHGAPFRPQRARVVAYALMVGVTVTCIGLALFAPVTRTLYDYVGFLTIAALIDVGLWRQASVSAVPSAAGLTVRNLVITTELEWAQIISVRFGDDRPWVQLDLDDGEPLAVMAIQRADGERADREAQRLADLVELGSRPAPT